MTRYVALLRGINVGGNTRVPMADLRRLLSELGYTGVQTLLQSGNAVLSTADPEPANIAAQIADRLAQELALDIRVMVRTADELREVLDRNPLEVRNPAKLHVAFLEAAPDPAGLTGLDPASYAPEEVIPGDRVVYLYFPDGVGRSKLPQSLERRLKVAATLRNWNTLSKLRTLADADQG